MNAEPNDNDSFFASIAKQITKVRTKPMSAKQLRQLLAHESTLCCVPMRFPVGLTRNDFEQHVGVDGTWNSDWVPVILQLLHLVGINVTLYRNHQPPTRYTRLTSVNLDTEILVAETKTGYYCGARKLIFSCFD